MKKIFWFLLFYGAAVPCLLAQEVFQAHTHVRLISEQDAVAPGQTFWVALDLKMDEGWHVYWRNPGDSGMAPKIKWQLPPGFQAGEIQWPYPQRINIGPLTNYGYEHEVLLLVPLTVDGGAPASQTAALGAHVDWLVCGDMCIPGRADLSLSIPFVPQTSAVTLNSSKLSFDQTRRDWPQPMLSMMSHAMLDAHQWHLHIQTPLKKPGEIVFYPLRDDVIEPAAPQALKETPFGYEIDLQKSHLYQGQARVLEGVAVNTAGWDESGRTKAVMIQAPVETAALGIPLWVACLFAAIGGLILNLMPCVLPVLSIKVLHLVERHPDRGRAFRHSLVYALGILASVWLLAVVLFVLKAAGKFAGWGFQFQSPVFVISVAVILFVLALNLFGVFEFSMPAISGKPSAKEGYQASFISGIITTIVATPCTAPFMGTALTVALSQPGLVGLGIFTFLGLGLSLPFVLLSAFPSLLSLVPKPGLWMVYLKRALGVVLLACVLWLGWVFGIQTGLGDMSKIFRSSQDIPWQDYSPSAVSLARQQGHGVFIDFTAAWCINCQVNDLLVFKDPRVVQAFKAQGIAAFKGDWTKYDPLITQALASFGRESIPVYVYYPPGSNSAVILPQLITPDKILDQVKSRVS